MDNEAGKQRTVDIFDRAAATYDSVGPRFFTYFAEQLVETARLSPGARVLDVATGRGAILLATAAAVGAAGHVTGIDLAPDMIARTAELIKVRALSNADAQVLDAEQLTFPDATFDAVLCGFAIFFFPDYERALMGFRRVLKPGGQLALSTWGAQDDRYSWLPEVLSKHATSPTQAQIRQTRVAQGPAWDKPEGLQEVLTKAGFTDIRVIETARDFYYATEQEWLDVQWSHGARAWLEGFPPDALVAVVSDVFERLHAMRTPEGIPQHQVALYALAKS